MSRPDPSLTAELLAQVEKGDSVAAEQLMPLVYDELRRLAQHMLKHERPDFALQATALVNEAYVRLLCQDKNEYQNRAHFFAIAAKMIRRALVDHARAQRAEKRGGGAQHVTLHDDMALTGSPDRELDMLALHEALTDLESNYARAAHVVELRFFAGLTVEETAKIVDISARTVKEDWRFARAWLRDRLGDDHPGDGE